MKLRITDRGRAALALTALLAAVLCTGLWEAHNQTIFSGCYSVAPECQEAP